VNIAAASSTAHITGWDRFVVIVLGGAGCALSYDALQQMAVAIHVRGPLTYLYPLVIDGFIAYGIRALLVLRNAPLRARAYVWFLVGVATTASIWANALHALRLNEERASVTGLRLGDTVVAVLSTIAPLALAGAVHLYILIARERVKDGDRPPVNGSDRGDLGHSGRPERVAVTRTDRAGQQQPQAGQVSAGQPATELTRSAGQDTDRTRLSLAKHLPDTRTVTGDSPPTHSTGPVNGGVTGGGEQVSEAADLGGHSGTAPADSVRSVTAAPVTDLPVTLPSVTAPAVTAPPVTDRDNRSAGDRGGDLDTEELLKIARSAVQARDKLTRKVVAEAIRGQQIPLSNDTLTALMVQLREQPGPPVTTSPN
jgi:hypothetical protein